MKAAILFSLSFASMLHHAQCQPNDLDSPITIKKAFDSVDANKDGAITFEEFKNQIRSGTGRNPSLTGS